MTNPTSNFGWQMPTATDLVTDLPADFAVFGQAVDTSMADLKGGTTGQILSKATNTDMDFTWITNDQGDITAVNTTAPLQGGGTSGALTLSIDAGSTTVVGAVQLEDSTASTSTTKAATPNSVKSAYDLANGAIAKTTVTTAGDIIYRNATVPTRLGIGTAGQILAVNSGATAPEWTTPAASSSGMTLISSTTLTSTATDFTFTSIPSTYTHLKLVLNGRTNESGANVSNIKLQLNGDTGSNYRTTYGGSYAGSMSVTTAGADTSFDLRYINGVVQTTYGMGISEIILPDYKGTVLRKGIQWITTCYADSGSIFTGNGSWQNTSAITSVKILAAAGSFIVGSSVSLYGWS